MTINTLSPNFEFKNFQTTDSYKYRILTTIWAKFDFEIDRYAMESCQLDMIDLTSCK